MTSILPFSILKRNGCDSAWQDDLRLRKANIFIGDSFNYCTFRGNMESHTWKIAQNVLESNSVYLGMLSEEYINAE